VSLSTAFDANAHKTMWGDADIGIYISPVRERGAYRVILGAADESLNQCLIPRNGGWPLAVMDDFGTLVGVPS
jgi:hypothetical protein